MTGVLGERADVLWKLAIPMIRDYPLTGIGMGSFIIEVSNYAKAYGIRKETPGIGGEPSPPGRRGAGDLRPGPGLLDLLGARQTDEAKRLGIPSGVRGPMVVSGAVAGIVAYLLAIQVHTFIGSYEIKYFFWLLAAIASRFGARPDAAEGSGKAPNARPGHGSSGCQSRDSSCTAASFSGTRPIRSPLKAGPGNSASARISASPGRRKRRTAGRSGGPAAMRGRPSASKGRSSGSPCRPPIRTSLAPR